LRSGAFISFPSTRIRIADEQSFQTSRDTLHQTPLHLRCTSYAAAKISPRIHKGRTNPSVVARVLRTSSNTRIIPTNGTKPAAMMIESKECVARD
jgi:hypothetical protein